MDYAAQRINSERSLQASFWSHLIPQLAKTRRVFIEPTLTFSNGCRVVPDIVVTNSRKVIAVIELKYTPKGPAKWAKDLRTLANVAAARGELAVSHGRHLGEAGEREQYRLASHVLFVWAGVHKAFKDGAEYFADGYSELDDCYLQLHAETIKGCAPEISYVVPER